MTKKQHTITIRGKNELFFRDVSSLQLNETWLRALSDKLKHERRTPKDFLSDFSKWLEERWKTKTCSDKFGDIVKWEEADEFSSFRTDFNNLADLAENELYYYLRAWIMGLILSEHGGKGSIILTEDGVIEYPSRISSDEESMK